MKNSSIFVVCFFVTIGLYRVSPEGLEKAVINVKHCVSSDPGASLGRKIDVTCSGRWHISLFAKNQDFTCEFQLYDGTIVNWSADTYYNRNYKMLKPGKSDDYHCGLTVDLPENDMANATGLWKCWITYVNKYDNETKIMGAMVNLPDPKSKHLTPEVITKQVYVARGDNFVIECQVPYEIELCFMRSPNGTLYAVPQNTSLSENSIPTRLFYYRMESCFSKREKAPRYSKMKCYNDLQKKNILEKRRNAINRLELTGDGFHMGVCAAVIENSDDAHNGTWTCQLGLVDGIEVEKKVPVHVRESYLIGSVKKNGAMTTLQCNKFPDFSSDIINCRWALPNYTGIYKKNSTTVNVMQNSSHCVLQLNEWRNEYAGVWSCYAQFDSITSGNEDHPHIFDGIEYILV